MTNKNFYKSSPANKPGVSHRWTNVAEQTSATAALLRAKADNMDELAAKLAHITSKSGWAASHYKQLRALLDGTIQTLESDREWLESYWAAKDLYPEWGAAEAAPGGAKDE